MVDRPILFSAPMARALLAGSKTQTRRVIKPQPAGGVRESVLVRSGIEDGHGREIRPRFEPGDRAWVREAWQVEEAGPWTLHNVAGRIHYAADGGKPPIIPTENGFRTGRWRPSIHMPRWASRATLLIDDVRVQRLQDISEEDAAAEGVTRSDWEYDTGECCDTAREAFGRLWDHINGPGAWASNPWVGPPTFRVVAQNIDSTPGETSHGG
jgi:hypothetical protein